MNNFKCFETFKQVHFIIGDFVRVVKDMEIKYNYDHMEFESDIPQERFMQLVSPEYEFGYEPDELFQTSKIIIPDLGTVRLSGVLGDLYSFKDDELGITVIEDDVVIEKASKLADMGLFLTDVWLEGPTTQDSPVICNMLLTRHCPILESEIVFDKGCEIGDQGKYKIRGDNRELILFAPADPKFLSQLQFSFRHISNISQNR